MIETLFNSEFMPHGMCYMWQPGLVWLHVVSDALIFLAYISIPATLVYMLRQRTDLIFSKVMALFGAFVLLCGFTHALAVWNVWNGTYWLSGTVKGMTAVVSVATAWMLWKLVPTLRQIPTVEKMQIEIDKRIKVEKLLQEKAERLVIESQRLENLNEELQAFAYASSHDLKSPLRGIKQLASWIEEDLETESIELPEDSKNHLALLQTRVTRMESLLDDLLEYSQVGHVNGDFVDVDMEQLSEELFDLLNVTSNVTLHHSSLPMITTIKSPLSQVLRNLFDNAIKHQGKEGGNIWIRITEINEFYEIQVEDDGIGVAPEDFEKITKIFCTLKSKDEVEGSGMGLAIINKIITKFGGELKFESPAGKGLTVIFTWPKEELLKRILFPVGS